MALLLWSIILLPLHNATGEDVYVNLDQVDFIGPCVGAFCPPNGYSRVLVYGIWFYLRETPTQIHDMIYKMQGETK